MGLSTSPFSEVGVIGSCFTRKETQLENSRKLQLGGGFSNMFYFIPGGMIQIY